MRRAKGPFLVEVRPRRRAGVDLGRCGSMDRHLIVFARAPRVGAVKARLAGDIGAVAAWKFQRDTLRARCCGGSAPARPGGRGLPSRRGARARKPGVAAPSPAPRPGSRRSRRAHGAGAGRRPPGSGRARRRRHTRARPRPCRAGVPRAGDRRNGRRTRRRRRLLAGRPAPAPAPAAPHRGADVRGRALVDAPCARRSPRQPSGPRPAWPSPTPFPTSIPAPTTRAGAPAAAPARAATPDARGRAPRAAAAGSRRSCRGRKRLSSCHLRISSQPSRHAPGDPGSANR